MALRFFNNIVSNNIDTNPDTIYRDLQQEFINLQWENTTQIITVKEEEDIGSKVYNDLDIWISPTVADTSTGLNILALLYSNIYDKIPLIVWKLLRVILLQHKDEINLSVNAKKVNELDNQHPRFE